MFHPVLTCRSSSGQLTSQSPHNACVLLSFGEAFEVLRIQFNHHLLVLWSLAVRINSVSIKRFQAQFPYQEFYHATSRLKSLQGKTNIPGALPACTLGKRIEPSSSNCPSFIRQPFSQRVVRNLNFVASPRFMSSTTPCANKLSNAFSQSLRPLLACRARRPPPGN